MPRTSQAQKRAGPSSQTEKCNPTAGIQGRLKTMGSSCDQPADMVASNPSATAVKTRATQR